MSKKKNKKFKKAKSNSPIVSPIQRAETMASNAGDRIENAPASTGAIAVMPVAETVDPRYLLIRKEVKTVLLTILILLIVLIGAYILEVKTGALDKVGGWIYDAAHIQTQ